MSTSMGWKMWSTGIAAMVLLLGFAPSSRAQGILTVTPGRSVSTAAGTGVLGYTGNNGNALAATLASPSSVAYDPLGNLFLADANNHVIREISKSGIITTVAGSGIAGFGGDGGSATSAFLDTPMGVAVDSIGNLYIADSHNHRIRKVSGGTITTIAGTGIAGFSGDGGLATAANLALPSAIAVDATGNIYIADTNNQRIRKVSGNTIATVAGNGEELYAGDGGAATAASLDLPTGVAIDSTGKLYIADRQNQRIRVVDTGGNISTLAGSGMPNFAGGFSGNGSNATAATLSKPSGVSVDAAGTVYIADTNNQRIRQVGGGAIATIAGTGDQGFGGDGAVLTSAVLDTPRALGIDAVGNLSIADMLNERVRLGALPILIFTSTAIGTFSPGQTVTLTNSGTASISVTTIGFTGAFASASGGTCSATPITLAPAASCTQNVAFVPMALGPSPGSVAFSGIGVVSQTILLSGTGSIGATTTNLTSSNSAPLIGQAVTFTATVTPAGGPTGTVSFFNGAILIGTAQPLSSAGVATLTTTFGVAGTYSITAVYSGDTIYSTSTSAALLQLVGDFNFTLTPDPSNPAQGPDFSITVIPGGAATFNFIVQPLNGPFTYLISLSASGLPPGATVLFTPQTITLGATAAKFSMTIQTAKTAALLRHSQMIGGITLGMLLLPFVGRLRQRGRKMRPLMLCMMCLAALGGITGCGSGSGYFGQPRQSYTINVIATAQGSGGSTVQHVASVTLVVQ